MSKATGYLLMFVAAGLMVAPAQASMLSIVGGGNFSNTAVSGQPAKPALLGTNTGNQLGYEGGALLDMRAARYWIFELGGLYDHHKQAGASGFIETNQIQIPVDMRLRFSRSFSIGAGGFYSFATGNLKLTDGSGNSLYDGSYGGKLTSSDYGVLGSVRLSLMRYLFVDGRYLYGLKNINDTSDGSTYKSREIQAMIGLSFPLGY